jgi:hypothetical protein
LRFPETLLFLRIFYIISKTKPAADMTGNNKKTLPIINNNASGSSEKEIRGTYREISPGCGCGAASCENCPGISGMEMGSGSDKNYRNVFSYLRVVAVILAATWIVKEALNMF